MPARARNLTSIPAIALTCVMAILLCLAQSASAVAAKSPGKTASGIFFGDPNIYTGETLPESQQPQWEIDLVTTPTASGRQVWLSADPIGEAGGVNLYGYVLENPVNSIDSLGLLTIGSGLTIQGGVGGGGGASIGIYIGKTGWNPFTGWSSGVLVSGELGVQTPGGSAAGFLHFSDADTVDQLKGSGWTAGGSVGDLVTGGVEFSGGLKEDCRGFPTEGSNGVNGIQFSLGPGAWAIYSPIPVEIHSGISTTVGPTWGAKNGGNSPIYNK